MPAIRSVIVILLILRIGHIMDVGFEQVFLMMNGAVSDVADVFDTYVYRLGVKQGQFSFSTAVGLFKSVVGLILVVAANKLAKKNSAKTAFTNLQGRPAKMKESLGDRIFSVANAIFFLGIIG